MIQTILFAIWFLLPAALSNAAPIFAATTPFLKRFNTPIDGGRKWRGHALLGPHKTWRGIVAGIVVATFVLWFQVLAFRQFEWVRFVSNGIDYSNLPVAILGPLFAIGALGGDAIESFIKRSRGIGSGKAWIPFDQLDYIIGSVLVSLFFLQLSLFEYVVIFIIWFLMHVIFSYIGFKLKLKKDPI